MINPLRSFKVILLTSIIFLVTTTSFAWPGTHSLPITSKSLNPQLITIAESLNQGLGDFVLSVKNGDPNTIVGVYVPDLFAVRVLQQPANNPGFVFRDQNTVTQFNRASQFGTIGLLAHNYLSGKQFFQIKMAKVFYLVYGNGVIKPYIVSGIKRFQALQPESILSDFVDLQKQGIILSSNDVFNQMYNNGDQVVFQTCIEKGDNWSWGRLFVIATPYSGAPSTSE
jgi:hypothetical protein